jgi:hypothetical protein
LNNLSFTVNYNPSLENNLVFAELCIVTYFSTPKSSCLISRPGKAGSYKQPLIQQIAHAAFHPLGRGSIFLAIVTSSNNNNGGMREWGNAGMGGEGWEGWGMREYRLILMNFS